MESVSANHIALRINQSQGQATRLQAVVLQAPRALPESEADVLQTIPSDVRSTMLVRAIRANSSDMWLDVSGTVAVTMEGVPDQVRAGDCVQLTGVLRRICPAEPRTNGLPKILSTRPNLVPLGCQPCPER
ncbi:MAG: hypothetical protein R3C28_23845 [Pirellulaceae bacterium]